EVTERAKLHLLDTLAAMISGSRLLPGRRAIGYVKTLGGTREATVVGTRIVTTAINAALANGVFAHADETDDSHRASITHPGAGPSAGGRRAPRRARDGGAQRARWHCAPARNGGWLRRRHTAHDGARPGSILSAGASPALLRWSVRRGGGGRRVGEARCQARS